MALRSETPPPPGDLDFGEPPDSDNPTSAQLKGDIDSGRTGDKVRHGDIGAAPLGTCDEAGGTPPTPQRVKLARTNEAASEQIREMTNVDGQTPWLVPAFVIVTICIGIALCLSILLFR